jgi:hypothetical protein
MGPLIGNNSSSFFLPESVSSSIQVSWSLIGAAS